MPTPAPEDLQLENHLASKPPSLVRKRGSVRQSVAVAAVSDVETFGASILGLSVSGKNVAIHLGRKAHTYANSDGLHFVLVAPLPPP